MRISGSATVAAPLTTVWTALQDPAVLARTIPGCLRLEAVGEDAYEMTVTAGVASIKGTYVGRVELTDPEPCRSFVLRARGQGAPGTVDATVRVSLSLPGAEGAEGAEGTAIGYDAEAVVGGMIGGVGQRMLAAVARRTAAEFFAAVECALIEPAPPPVRVPEAAPAAAPASAAVAGRSTAPVGTVYAAPERAGAEVLAGWGGTPAKGMLAAFTAGGSVALAGVLAGYLLARRSR